MNRNEIDSLLSKFERGDYLQTKQLLDLEYVLTNVGEWALRLGTRGHALRYWAFSTLSTMHSQLRNRGKEPNEHYGAKCYRWEQNPEEKRFAEAWAELTKSKLGSRGRHFIDLVMAEDSNASYIAPVSREARVAAASAIQWLGTPVGQSFLKALGYERVDRVGAG